MASFASSTGNAAAALLCETSLGSSTGNAAAAVLCDETVAESRDSSPASGSLVPAATHATAKSPARLTNIISRKPTSP